jgi:acyl carrier protein
MTAEPLHDDPARELLAEMVALLRKVTGEDPRWADEITLATRLEADLFLDSLELTALSDLARDTYGDEVDLAAFVSGLDLDQIIGLTVGDLVARVAAVRNPTGPPARPWPGAPGAPGAPGTPDAPDAPDAAGADQ